MKFYLGTDHPSWLWMRSKGTFPVCVSHAALATRRSPPPPATRPWLLDSGAFSILDKHHEHVLTAAQYARRARWYADAAGMPDHAAPQDWMCEPSMLAKTGLTVAEHQQRTVANGLDLRMADAGLPWRYALQGWDRDDYLRCWDLYGRHGVRLEDEPLVFLGSVCRRQDTRTAEWIVRSLAPLRLHGLGIKTTGLLRFGHRIISADSMSWSITARREGIRLPGHPHRCCHHCPVWAERWRAKVLRQLAAAEARGRQGDLLDPDENWQREGRGG